MYIYVTNNLLPVSNLITALLFKKKNSLVKKPNYPLWISIILTVLLLLALPKVLMHKNPDNPAQQSRARTTQQIVNVSAVIVRPQLFQQTLTVPGSVLANEQVQLKAETNGRIVKLALKEGAEARKNDLLVKINDADLQAQLEKAKAALKLAQDREKRQNSLFEKNLISQEERDVATKELGVSIAEVDLLKALIDKTEIRAPFDGRIGLRMVSEGSYLSIGAPVADFVKVTPLKIEFSVPERYTAAVVPGALCTFTVNGSMTSHTARVYARQPAIDEATRTLRVRALCNESEKGILPGAFAEVRLPLGKNDSSFMIPSQAIVPDMKGQNVLLVKNGNGIKKPVEIGERTGSDVQVTKGLSTGDTVITSGVLMVKPGMPVKINTFETQN
jgi:membrane fusion protein (multidrug efflux system)